MQCANNRPVLSVSNCYYYYLRARAGLNSNAQPEEGVGRLAFPRVE
jgi:hypothetical protein